MAKRFKGPRSACGFEVMPKHLPGCTPAFRAEEGCWCFLSTHPTADKYVHPTAREWRKGRRRAVRSRRLWRDWQPSADGSMVPFHDGRVWRLPQPRMDSWAGLL